MSEKFNSVLIYLPYNIRKSLEIFPNDVKKRVHEIRIKNGLPLSIVTDKGIIFPTLYPKYNCSNDKIVCSKEDVNQVFRTICGYSVYSHTEEIKRGFISLKGGHRVGVCGSGVYEKDNLSAIKDISSLNIRIAREIFGAADDIISNFSGNVYSTLIVGSPGSGKTTILRDITRRLANGTTGRYNRVFVADERFEISASYDGIIQNNLGESVDVMCGIPKIDALKIGVRCFSPEVMIIDEIGSNYEAEMLTECFFSGAKIIATTHAKDEKDVMNKEFLSNLIKNRVFEKVVILKEGNQNGAIKRIYNSDELC